MKKILGMALVATIAATTTITTETHAQEWDVTFIQVHPDGPVSSPGSTSRALGIFNGTELGAVVDQRIDGSVFTLDFGGGNGSFLNEQSPYLNPDATDNFLQYVSGTVTIPAGEYTVGCGSDDGCFINLPGISLINTFAERAGANRPLIDGDGEAFFDGTRGHNWTGGTFVIEEDVTTGVEALFFENGGGDSFEVAYVPAIYDPDLDGDFNDYMTSGIELDGGRDAGGFGVWELTGDPFMAVIGDPNDLNGDGAVDQSDFTVMADNWGNPYNFDDFFAFATAFNAPAGAAVSSVPEPAGISLLAFGLLAGVLSLRQRIRS